MSAAGPPIAPSSGLKTLLLGNCFVHWPLRRTGVARGRFALDGYGPIGEVHSFGEIFQVIEVLSGEREVPLEYRSVAHMHRKLGRLPPEKGIGNADLVLLAPSSPVEISFRGVAVNRTALMRVIAGALQDDTEEASKYLARWSRIGLVGLNESVREASAAKLLEFLRPEAPAFELARAAILETRAWQGDLRAGFHRMRELFPGPTGVILYTFRYMPDGRPISWPATYRDDILRLATEFRLPLFDPVPLVNQYGVQEALRPGHSHYSDSFLPVIGEAIADFAKSAYDSCSSRGWQERGGELVVS